jgi:hypothetical protein
VANLLSQYAIFLDEIVNRLVLPLVQPTRDGNHEKRKWIQTRSHPRSLSRASARSVLLPRRESTFWDIPA